MDGFQWAQPLRITVDRLAVRRGPSTASGLVLGARWEADKQAWIETDREVRLNAGDTVTVVLGPIQRDGYLWYHVQDATQRPLEQERRWISDGDDVYGDAGWIATSGPDGAFVEALDTPALEGPLPLVFAGGGSGTYQSAPIAGQDGLVLGGRYALSTGDWAPCYLSVAIEPTGDKLLETSLAGAIDQGRLEQTPYLSDGPYRVRVTAGVPDKPEAECSWAISVAMLQ